MSAPKELEFYMARAIARFESKFVKPENNFYCWEWQAGKSDGYAQFSYRGKPVKGYKFAWAVYRRIPIPAGYVLDHTCNNRACVNPWHLELVTYGENISRGHRARKSL